MFIVLQLGLDMFDRQSLMLCVLSRCLFDLLTYIVLYSYIIMDMHVRILKSRLLEILRFHIKFEITIFIPRHFPSTKYYRSRTHA